VITLEDWITIRNIKGKNSDISNREIARILKISHNTVKKAIENELGPEYKRTVPINPIVNSQQYFGKRIFCA